MTIQLTERMKAWIEGLGCHLCTAPEGIPNVVVAPLARVVGPARVAFPHSSDNFKTLYPKGFQKSWVSFGVSHLGSVRAPYQFKGVAEILYEGSLFLDLIKEHENQLGIAASVVLLVNVREVYCTKPGYLAGQRLDVLGYDGMCALEKSLGWIDVPSSFR